MQVEVNASPESKVAIEAALADKEMLAYVTLVGLLLPFTKRAQVRILRFVDDHLDEQAELAAAKGEPK